MDENEIFSAGFRFGILVEYLLHAGIDAEVLQEGIRIIVEGRE